MTNKQIQFHFDRDIELKNPPLVEAWLEVQWELEPVDPPEIMRDRGFSFALGPFFESVKEKYPVREALPASEAPESLLPHVVRFRFRSADGDALVQIGPGIATVNFLKNYSRGRFLRAAIDLQTSLVKAYSESDTTLKTKAFILRYRNAELFDYENENLFDFVGDYLNIAIELSPYIPGPISSKTIPTSTKLDVSFDLEQPKGIGNIQIVTGKKRDSETEHKNALIWEIAIASRSEDAPDISEPDVFEDWLNSANQVAHEWFFSLVDGKLLEKYR